MQTFRRRMPVVIIFLIIMFVGLFVYEWGYERTGRNKQGQQQSLTAVASVNGEELSLAEFDAEVKRSVKDRRDQNPDAPIDEEQIRDQIYQQMINETLIRQAAHRIGVDITDDEVRESMLYDPPQSIKGSFTDSSGFHSEQYYAFITDVRGFINKVNAGRPANQKITPDKIEETVDQVIRMEKGVRLQKMVDAVQAVVAAPAIPSAAEVRQAYFDEHTKVSGNFVVVDPSAIPDSSIKITDDEARKYYEAHKSDFPQKAGREARYVLFPLVPSGQDSAAVTTKLKQINEALNGAATPAEKTKAFDDFVKRWGTGKYRGTEFTPMQELGKELLPLVTGAEPGAVIGPVHLTEGNYMINVMEVKDTGDTYVKASHILLKTEGKNDDSVKALAAKVLTEVRGGGSFEALATKYSGDQGTAQKGGDLGYFKKGAMVPEFDSAAFSMSTGQISGLVKTKFGYHIIKVIDRSSRSYKIRDMKFDAAVSGLTKTQLKKRAQGLRDKLTNGMNIDTAATQLKLTALATGPVDRMTATGGSMRFTSFIYDGKAGDVSEVYELKNGAYLVGQISKVHGAGVMEFADAKELITQKLRQRKKVEMIKARAERLFGSLGAGDSLSKLTAIDSSIQVRAFNDATITTPFAGVGVDYSLTSAIFALKPGQRTGLIRGERGYYIAMVTRRTDPTDKDLAAERDKYVKQLIQQRRQQLFQDWLDKERDHATIVDYRNQR